MTENVDIALNLDASGYVQGGQQAITTTTQLQGAVRSLATGSTAAARALDLVTPKRAAIGAMTAFSSVAAATEARLSDVAARSVTANQNFQRLAAGTRQLAREFPIGSQGAEALTRQLQRSGVAALDQNARLTTLGRTITKLSGAVGEDRGGLAAGLIQVQRAFGDTNIDPKRFDAVADSLTTVSSKAGASATAVTDMTKNLAPMAKAAGLGATATLGISTAMAKMGEDGYSATNAMGKMLTDLNKSVRDGSSEMNVYANIVGKTREEFEALFKANPAEALAQITEAFARPGGERELERVGLDGVRTARVLQQLSNQGGIRSEVATAVSAYGNGSTEKASERAFGGLFDAFQEAQTAAEQLAEAMGRPLLSGLEKITRISSRVTGGAVGAVNTVTDNSLGRAVLGGGGMVLGVLGTLIMRSISAATARTLIGSQLVRSGIVGGLTSNSPNSRLGQWARSGGALAPGQNFADNTAGRAGRSALDATTAFSRERAEAQARRMNASFDRLRTAGMNEAAERVIRPPARPGNVATRALGGAAFWGSSVLGAYSRMQRDLVEQSRVPNNLRESNMRGGSNERQLGRDLRSAVTGGDVGIRQALANYRTAASSAATGTTAMNRTITAATKSFTSAALAAGSMAKALAMAGGSALASSGLSGVGAGLRGGLGKAMGLVGGPAGLALMGGLGIAGALRSNAGDLNDEVAANKGRSISASLDSYRESMGIAGESTMSFAQAATRAGAALSRQVTSVSTALKISESDRQYANDSKSQVARKFTGNEGRRPAASDVASILNAENATGYTARDVQAIKIDLQRQFSDSFVEDVLKNLNAGAASDMGSASSTSDMRSAFRGILGQTDQFYGSDSGFSLKDFGNKFAEGQSQLRQLVGMGPGRLTAGGRFNRATVTDEAASSIQGIAGGITQQRSRQSDMFGADYGNQEMLRSSADALREAAATGSQDILAATVSSMSEALGINLKKVGNLTAGQIEDEGGDPIAALAARDPKFAERLREMQTAGVDYIGEGIRPEYQMTTVARTAATGGRGGTFAQSFDTRPGMGNALTASAAGTMQSPGNAQALNRAVEAQINATDGSVDSLLKLARESQNVVASFSDASHQASVFARSVSQRAAQEIQARAPDQTQMETNLQEISRLRESYQANLRGTDAESGQAAEQDRQSLVERIAVVKQGMKERLAAIYQAQVQERRSGEDNRRTREYAEADFERNRTRTQFTYELGRQRAAANFQRQELRGQEAFQRQERRSFESFNRQVDRSQDSFYRGRQRAERDFAKQMERQATDSARAMFDPYQRIATQAVWDARQLLGNLQEQNEQVQRQMENLERARAAGVSEDTIVQLGLNKAENAQQLAYLINDVTSDPAVAAALNAATETRLNLGRSLFGDAANEAVTRAKEDFLQQLGDQESEFRISLDQQREDFGIGLAQSREDFNIAFGQSREDYNRGMAEQAADHDRMMRQAEDDQVLSLGRMNDAYNLSLTRMREDIFDSSREISLGLEQLTQQTNAALNGQMVSWGNITRDGVQSQIGTILGLVESGALSMPDLFANAGAGGAANPRQGDNASGWRSNNTSSDLAGLLIPPSLRGTGGPNDAEALSHSMAPPVGGPVTSGFGPRRSPGGIGSRNHVGIDYGVPTGTPVKAALGGTVQSAGVMGGYGNIVIIDHGGGRTTRYAHLSQFVAEPGDMVNQGEVIARSGNTGNSTGPHLHFETRQNGVAQNPMEALGAWQGTAASVQSAVELSQQGKVLAREMVRALSRKGFSLEDAERLHAMATDDVGDISAPPGGAKGNAANIETGRRLAASRGWTGKQFDALQALWSGESGWNHTADNPSSSAYGIPQALIGLHKMPAGYYDRKTGTGANVQGFGGNPAVQIEWGLNYIKNKYGSPANAYSTWKGRSPHWYGEGGIFTGASDQGNGVGVGDRGPELALPLNDRGVRVLAAAFQKYATSDEVKVAQTAGARTHVTYHQDTYSYDHSTRIEGEVTVVAQDPNEMARKLAAKQRRDNLVGRRS